MTQELKLFLQDPEIQLLINMGDWEKLFLYTTPIYNNNTINNNRVNVNRIELYSILKDADLFSKNKSEFSQENYYALYSFTINGGINILSISGRIKDNLYGSTQISKNKISPELQVVLKSTFLDILKICMEKLNGTFLPVKIDNTNNYYNIPIELQFYSELIGKEFLASQEGIDLFDPTKIRDRNILAAAKDEFNKLLLDIVKKGIGNNISQLKEKLISQFIQQQQQQNTNNNNDNIVVDIFFKTNRCIIEYTDRNGNGINIIDKDQVLKIIKQNIKGPLTVTPHPVNKNTFIIAVNKNKFNQIKLEIEDMFDIELS